MKVLPPQNRTRNTALDKSLSNQLCIVNSIFKTAVTRVKLIRHPLRLDLAGCPAAGKEDPTSVPLPNLSTFNAIQHFVDLFVVHFYLPCGVAASYPTPTGVSA